MLKSGKKIPALRDKKNKYSRLNGRSLMLKVKYLELNPSSGHYGYKSHNFNVIPEKIKALVPVCIQSINKQTEYDNLVLEQDILSKKK
jgi:hypothetical protein